MIKNIPITIIFICFILSFWGLCNSNKIINEQNKNWDEFFSNEKDAYRIAHINEVGEKWYFAVFKIDEKRYWEMEYADSVNFYLNKNPIAVKMRNYE